MKVSELTDELLDAWVAKAEGVSNEVHHGYPDFEIGDFCPSLYWAHGGPIIDRERISLHGYSDGYEASSRLIPTKGAHMAPCYRMKGTTALQAAMRCFVASVYGEEVDDIKQ